MPGRIIRHNTDDLTTNNKKMNTRKLILATISAILFSGIFTVSADAQNLSGTYMFAKRDTCNLFFDVYDPTPGSETTFEGIQKPTLLFVYGGGFVGGFRSNERYFPWFKILNDNGYKLITIDYRLGLKGVPMSFSLIGKIKTAKNTVKAVEIGAEALFSAVNFIVENAGTLGVDPKNIVLVGNSSGAIISLGAENFICNGEPIAAGLPEGFNFKGLISFAGAIVDDNGTPKYAKEPCPTIFMHGTADGTVQYRKTQVFKLGMWGTDILAGIFKKNGYNYCVYRFHEHKHDIADNYAALWPYQKYFLEQNIMLGRRCIIDAYIDDPSVPSWEAATLDSLY